MTLSFGYLIGFRIHTSVLDTVAAVAISIAFALCFCWISVFVGMVVRSSGAVQGVMFLLVLPLSFASNTFVKVSTMPGWLQDFVKVNPISHLVSIVRALMLGGPIGDNLLWTVGWMAVLVAVFVPLALRAYASHA